MAGELLHHSIIFVLGVVFGWGVKDFVKGLVKGK
jgi:hypothetical protein